MPASRNASRRPAITIAAVLPAKTLHPELFRSLDIKRETLDFYAKYFHYALTDDDYASIMNAAAPR